MNNSQCILGRIIIAAGIMILLYLILPTAVLWFIFGIALICIGTKVCRYRR